MKMNENQVNEYMEKLIKGEVALEGVEADVFDQFKGVNQAIQQGGQQIEARRAELEQLTNEHKKLQGRVEGLAQVLIGAETQRRENATEAPLKAVDKQDEANDGETANA